MKPGVQVSAGAILDPLVGRVFDGRYRLESLLGRGGMGAVYKATQITMNKTVAVKVVKPEYAGNSDAAKRFHREAKAASSLSHPHSIRVFDFGQAPSGELYMAMEFLDGRSLGKLLCSGERLSLQRTLKIVAEIASSLVEAHGRGLVHRDLKPDNVVLLTIANDPDFVKVLDFGIAKFLSDSSGDSAVTGAGAIVGTPDYMAPEQAMGVSPLTTALDVYSLGVMLYEMLAGVMPFLGDSPLQVLLAHVREPIPPLPPGVGVPDDVRALLARMLAKDPEDRPAAAEVARELEESRHREMALSFLARRELPRPRTFRNVLAAGIATLAAAMLLLAWFSLRESLSEPPAPAPEAQAATERTAPAATEQTAPAAPVGPTGEADFFAGGLACSLPIVAEKPPDAPAISKPKVDREATRPKRETSRERRIPVLW